MKKKKKKKKRVCIDKQVAANLVVIVIRRSFSLRACVCVFGAERKFFFSLKNICVGSECGKTKTKEKKKYSQMNRTDENCEGCGGGQIDKNIVGQKWKNNDHRLVF